MTPRKSEDKTLKITDSYVAKVTIGYGEREEGPPHQLLHATYQGTSRPSSCLLSRLNYRLELRVFTN